jgi:uncharacterized delta-60 repeat protein
MSHRGRVRWLVSLCSALLTIAWSATPASAAGEAGATTSVGDSVLGVAAEGSGSVVAVGKAGSEMLIQRIGADGAKGTTFATSPGVARAVAVQPDGKVVVVGEDNGAMVIRRYLASGSPDSAFGSGGVVRPGAKVALAVTVGPCGDIVVGGSATLPDGFARVALVHLQGDGTPVAGFGTAGLKTLDYGKNSQANGVVEQADGKIVFAGQQAPGLQVTGGLVGRANVDGNSDQGFGTGGTYYYDAQGGANSLISSVALDAAGRIVGGGADVRADGVFAVVARLNNNGSLDGSFATGGVLRTPSTSNFTGEAIGIRELRVLSNGRIVGAGTYQLGGQRSAALYVVTPAGGLDNSVGTNGRVLTSPGPSGGEGHAVTVAPDGTVIAGGDTRDFTAQTPPPGYVTRYASLGAPLPATACTAPAPTPTPTPAPTPNPTPTPDPTPTPNPTPTPSPTPTPTPAAPRLTNTTLASRSISTRSGTVLSYRLSRQTTIYLTLEQRRVGRRSTTGHCSSASGGNRGGKRCAYYVRMAGSKRFTGHVGSHTVKVTTRISRRKLAYGSYRLRVRAVGGNTRLFSIRVVRH